MKIPIFIEATPDDRYRATGCMPLVGSIEADSPEAVLEMVTQAIKERVAQGARIVTIDIPDGENPWLGGLGMFGDDPLNSDWQSAIADYRRAANQSTDAP